MGGCITNTEGPNISLTTDLLLYNQGCSPHPPQPTDVSASPGTALTIAQITTALQPGGKNPQPMAINSNLEMPSAAPALGEAGHIHMCSLEMLLWSIEE